MVRTNFWFKLMMLVYWAEAYIHKEKTDALIFASKEIGLEVNADKTKYMIMSRGQNAGQSHNINIINSSFKRLVQFKYLGKTLTIKIILRKKLRGE